ncbi:thioredoxin family protein [Panacagrimonas sp.]|uniref:thioredoxin family protein n=1 Tax=Panacagrimonas sp. TaxID=2480088 RepID=UPI003B52AAD9
MALTPSKMLPLGTPAPEFTLSEPASGGQLSLADVRGPVATLVMFICNHCPYVKHVNPELVRVARDYAGRGVGMVAISSNDANAYPDDAPDRMAIAAQQLGYTFPYLYDAEQSAAAAYAAACTPDFYLFDADLRLAYRGRLDASTPGNGQPLNGADLRAALESVVTGRAPAADQLPSVGCNIKWRKAS